VSGRKERSKRQASGVRMKEVREAETVKRIVAEHEVVAAQIKATKEQRQMDEAIEAWRQGPDNHLDDLQAGNLGSGP